MGIPEPRPWWRVAAALLALGGWGCARASREPSAEQRIDELARLPADMSLDSLRRAAPWLVCRTAKVGARFDHVCSWEASGFSVRAGTLDMRLAQIGVVWIGSGRPGLDLDAWARARYGTPAGSTICSTVREDSAAGAAPGGLLRLTNGVRPTVTWWTPDGETIIVRHGLGPWGALHLGSQRLHWIPSCDTNEGLDLLKSLPPDLL